MRSDSIDKTLLYVIWAGIFLLLFMPLVVTTETIFPFIVGKSFYTRLLIAGTFGAWSILAFRNPSYRVRASRLLGLLAVYLFVSLIAGIFGVSFQRSLWSTFERMQGIVNLAYWVALIVVLSSVIRYAVGWRHVFNANLAISAVMALIGIAQSQGVSGLPFYGYLQADERIGITLGNPSFVAAYLMVNVLIGLSFILQSFERRHEVSPPSQSARRRRRRRPRNEGVNVSLSLWRIFWIAATTLDLWVITLTGTRGAALGLLIGLSTLAIGYFMFGQWKALKIGLAAFVGLIVLAVLGFIALSGNPLVSRIASSNILLERSTNINLDQVPIRARLQTLSVGAQAFADRPVLGWGPENYLIPFGLYYTKGSDAPETLDQAHNKPVEELVTKGILGLISFGLLWAYAFFILVRRIIHMDQSQKIFASGLLAALAAYFVQNLFLFDTPATFLQFVLIISFVIYLDANTPEISANVDTGPSPRQGDLSASDDTAAYSGLASSYFVLQLRRLNISLADYHVKSLRWVGLVLAIVTAVLSIILNVRMMQSATSALNLTQQVRGIGKVIETLDNSTNAFPPLANYPRLILFNNAAVIWPDLTDPERDLVLASVAVEADKAIEQEPQNWRLYASLAKMYQEIAAQSPGYVGLDLARYYVNGAIRLAPERLETEPVLLMIEKMERLLAERR